MAYLTGSATGPSQLLDALRIFAVAHGWQELRWGPSGAGQQLSLQRADQFVHLRSAVNEPLRAGYAAVSGIFLVGADGFDAAQHWDNQPGMTRNVNNRVEACGLYRVTAPSTYHLLSSGAPVQLTLVAEVAPG